MPVLIVALFTLPLLGFLARFPQSPDGAEILHAAVAGGVLHPSGMPLQAWINRLFAFLYHGEPGLALSFVSWLGAFFAALLLSLILRRAGVGTWTLVLAAAAYVWAPTAALMSVIPEKYSWLACTQLLFIYFLLRILRENDPPARIWLGLGFALGLALAQHSANVIWVPAFGAVVLWRRECVRRWILAAGVAVMTAGLLYLSLLWMRSSRPWPDWGQLDTVGDVFRHVIRTDYGVVRLFDQDQSGARVSALYLLLREMAGWNFALFFVMAGLYRLVRHKSERVVGSVLILPLALGLVVLGQASMPAAGDLDAAMGYQERYPLLLWPVLAVLWGLGFEWVRGVAGGVRPTFRHIIWMVAAGGIAVSAFRTFHLVRYANNNLGEIYREQAASELGDFTVFWTNSDFVGFYGIPRGVETLFPVKGLMGWNWYRDKVLPALSPPAARVLMETHPENAPEFFRNMLRAGFRVVVTQPTAFLEHPDIMATAEQTGVLWSFSMANHALYTERLLENAVHLCGRLPQAWHGLPPEGFYFLREFVRSFRFVFLSAADFLESQSATTAAAASAAAREVAATLVPGRGPEEWGAKCRAFTSVLSLRPDGK